MNFEKNIIKKMTVEVDTNSMAVGLQLKDDIDSFIKEKIYPLLDALFLKNTKKNQIIHFENIEISIDHSLSNKIEDLAPKIISKIHKEIASIDTEKVDVTKKKHTVKSNEKSIQNAIVFYLKSGNYPWWFDENNNFNSEDFLNINKNVLGSVIYSTNSLDRLLYQFDIKIITNIYLRLNNKALKDVKQLGNIPSVLKNESFKVDFFRSIFQFKSSPHSNKLTNSILTFLSNAFESKINPQIHSLSLSHIEIKKVTELLGFCNEILEIPIQIIASEKVQNSYFLKLENDLKLAIKSNQYFEEKIVLKDNKKSIKISASEDSFLASKSVSKKDRKIVLKKEKILEASDPKLDESYEALLKEGNLINNAGLVLIHPFIKHFFEKLEFLSKGEIKKDKLDQAVHVLHYLATKREQPPEQLLIFEKFLCNIPLQQPIKRFISLTKFQKNACEELLQAMLEHWSALKTKNTDVLVNEFLSREGKLTSTKERDLLYIQRKTKDILLDSIPWNFHLVKIPWKKKLVFVEW